MKIYFDDITLAYKTLVNSKSREEYDLYISQYIMHEERQKDYWERGAQVEDEDPYVEERKRRRKERSKV